MITHEFFISQPSAAKMQDQFTLAMANKQLLHVYCVVQRLFTWAGDPPQRGLRYRTQEGPPEGLAQVLIYSEAHGDCWSHQSQDVL